MKPLYLSISVLSAGLLLSALTIAAEIKIGFVNMARIEEDAPQLDALRKKFENEFSPREKELVTVQRELKKLEDQIERDGATMTDALRNKIERDILSRRRDLKRNTEEFREDLTIRRNEELASLNRQVGDVIRDFARIEKFDLIFTTGVVYASDRVDVTGKIIEKLKGMR
ncbi:outer membrane protein [Gammaproteobacteria bacterium]